VAYKYDFAVAHNNLGVANRKLGQIKNAAKNFEKAIDINPSYTLAHLNLAIALADLGKKDDAVKCFEQVLSIEPDHSLAHEKLKELSSE
jgi:tetratricopeptide (TPR) repeat protein